MLVLTVDLFTRLLRRCVLRRLPPADQPNQFRNWFIRVSLGQPYTQRTVGALARHLGSPRLRPVLEEELNSSGATAPAYGLTFREHPLQHQLGSFVAGPGSSSSPNARRMRCHRPC